MDLQAGGKLRIVVPLFKSGRFSASDLSVKGDGATLSGSSNDFIGYMNYRYEIAGKKYGPVRLKFLTTEVIRDGKTTVESHPRVLPFALPLQTEYIRLVYLVRMSDADHNMAIMASQHREALDAFTKQFEANPNVCVSGGGIFCTWVPAGIAVRPEENELNR